MTFFNHREAERSFYIYEEENSFHHTKWSNFYEINDFISSSNDYVTGMRTV